MKDPAVAIKDYLVAQSQGVFPPAAPWGIAIGSWPMQQDQIILVNHTGGRNPFPHLLYNEPSVQIAVRGAKSGYQAARTKIRQIVNVMLGFTSQTLQGDVYRSCNQIGDVAYLGEDDNTRPILVANFWFTVLPAAEAGGHRVAIT
jgi:hypothetical protein